MITITDTITITNITMAFNTIVTRPGWDAHTYNNIRWERSSQFCWNIWIRDLLSPRSNCLLFLQNLRLKLSISRLWGIVRSHLCGYTRVMLQTIISTEIMISATINHPQHTSHYTLPASWCLVPATQQHSGSSTQEHTWEHIIKCDWKCLASWEYTCEHTAKQAWSMSFSAIGNILESKVASILKNILEGVLGRVLRVNFKVSSELNWDLQSCRQGVYKWVQSDVYIRAYVTPGDPPWVLFNKGP